MSIKRFWPVGLLALAVVPARLLAAEKEPATAPAPAIEEVAAFPKQQVTGISVGPGNRVFVNFPYWSKDHSVSVAEVLPGGELKPFPDPSWNVHDGPADKRWVCVQSVVFDEAGGFWVLDPASPFIEKVIGGGAKLVKFDLATNQPVQTIIFDDKVAPERSYLNDVRIDLQHQYAYLTESGVGSLVVVDLKSGKARRVLAGHASTKAEPGTEIVIDGIKPIDPKTSQTPEFNADGIALDREAGMLYYHALTGRTLYRIRTEHLRDESLSEEELAKKVEKVRQTPCPDGMLEGKNGTVYLTDIENNAILRYDQKGGGLTTLVKDQRLQWPDTLSWGEGGWLYVTTSQIHRQPKFNDGVSKQTEPFRVYRIRVP